MPRLLLISKPQRLSLNGIHERPTSISAENGLQNCDLENNGAIPPKSKVRIINARAALLLIQSFIPERTSHHWLGFDSH